MKTKIKQHEDKYWHIPKFKLGIIALLVLSLALTYGYSYIFINEWNLHNISFIFNCEGESCKQVTWNGLGFIPHLFFAYFLISSVFICLVAFIKGGFNNLKSYEEEGIFGLIFGLIWGLIWGLIGGLIWGLICGLIFGLIFGLTEEFR